MLRTEIPMLAHVAARSATTVRARGPSGDPRTGRRRVGMPTGCWPWRTMVMSTGGTRTVAATEFFKERHTAIKPTRCFQVRLPRLAGRGGVTRSSPAAPMTADCRRRRVEVVPWPTRGDSHSEHTPPKKRSEPEHRSATPPTRREATRGRTCRPHQLSSAPHPSATDAALEAAG